MKLPRRRWWAVIAVVGILILVYALKQSTLPLLARWLDVGGPPQKADAVVLLNGSLNTRPLVAAALVHGGWAPRILLNTVAPHPNEISGALPSSLEINLKILDYGGVARDRVVALDSAARTTFDEAQAVANYLASHPLQKLMIVTDGPHTRRSRWIFQRLLADRPVEILVYSGPTDEFDSDNWWRSEAGFLYVVSEYLKLFFYGLRYGWLGWLGYEIVIGTAVMFFLLAWFLRRRKLYL
jgi:uncharacterized SAM-binding protein YcdF (DUF218 family)